MDTDVSTVSNIVMPGAQFERIVTFDEAAARAFATMAGDFNPVHHDRNFAETSRFGGLIVSGTQTTAMMLGMTATFLAQFGPCVGLDAQFRFRRAVPMGETVRMAWRVTSVEDKPRLGRLVAMEGDLTLASGVVALTATSTAALLEAAQPS